MKRFVCAVPASQLGVEFGHGVDPDVAARVFVKVKNVISGKAISSCVNSDRLDTRQFAGRGNFWETVQTLRRRQPPFPSVILERELIHAPAKTFGVTRQV